MTLWQADELTVTVLIENWVDMLLPDRGGSPSVERCGLIHHFSAARTPPVAENGISFVVRASSGGRQNVVVFDAGLTSHAVRHNLKALNVDLGELAHVVISHGHPDHFGGITGLLQDVGHHVPVATHHEAFLPRYAVMGDGRVAADYNVGFTPEVIERSGGRPILTRDPLELGGGIFTSGEIPREVDFEKPHEGVGIHSPGLFQINAEGRWAPDLVRDEQALIIDVKDEGLVVLTGCAHAGVINTLQRAQQLLPGRPLRAVMGGFHLGFPTTPAENVGKTITALGEMDLGFVMPMHCSGLASHALAARQLGDRYLQPAVGTVLRFGG